MSYEQQVKVITVYLRGQPIMSLVSIQPVAVDTGADQ